MKIKCRCFKCKSTQDQDPIHRSNDLSVTHNRHIGVWDLEEMNYIKSKIMQLFLLFFSSFCGGGEPEKEKRCQISFSLVLTTTCKQCRICLAGDVNWMSARETLQHCERFRKDDRLITTLLRAYVYTDFYSVGCPASPPLRSRKHLGKWDGEILKARRLRTVLSSKLSTKSGEQV